MCHCSLSKLVLEPAYKVKAMNPVNRMINEANMIIGFLVIRYLSCRKQIVIVLAIIESLLFSYYFSDSYYK